MNVGELKALLKNVPDDVTVFIEDMGDFSISKVEVGTYHDNSQTYIDFIMPVYINSYFNYNNGQTVLL